MRYLTGLEEGIAIENRITADCERVWPGDGRRQAQRVMFNTEWRAWQINKIIWLMGPELMRGMNAPR